MNFTTWAHLRDYAIDLRNGWWLGTNLGTGSIRKNSRHSLWGDGSATRVAIDTDRNVIIRVLDSYNAHLSDRIQPPEPGAVLRSGARVGPGRCPAPENPYLGRREDGSQMLDLPSPTPPKLMPRWDVHIEEGQGK